MVAAPVEVPLERPEHERREQRLRVAERRVAHELEAREQRQRGEGPGQHAVPAAADQPPRHPEGHHAREQAAGPGHDQPQVGRHVVPEQGERGGEEDRQRLPRRAALGHEVEVRDLAAPHDPGPRVVGGRGRRDQADRRHHEAGGDQDGHRAGRAGRPRGPEPPGGSLAPRAATGRGPSPAGAADGAVRRAPASGWARPVCPWPRGRGVPWSPRPRRRRSTRDG